MRFPCQIGLNVPKTALLSKILCNNFKRNGSENREKEKIENTSGRWREREREREKEIINELAQPPNERNVIFEVNFIKSKDKLVINHAKSFILSFSSLNFISSSLIFLSFFLFLTFWDALNSEKKVKKKIKERKQEKPNEKK